MNQLQETIATTIAEHFLWRRRASLILAVSGGADSMAMLHLIAGLTDRPENLQVLHVHHGLRGRSADADARLVEKTALTLGLPFHLCRANVKNLAKKKQISIEMAAREVRHEFFHTLARKHRAIVATAHTSDDQAETVLLRLLRGTGTDGLGGIEYKTKIRGLTIVRPLLDISHADAVKFLRSQKLKWREDASNADVAMKRNRIRHELLPLLERHYNPRIREALARAAVLLSADAGELGRIANDELALRMDRRKTLSTTAPPAKAIWRRVLYSWLLRHVRIEPARLDLTLVKRVEHIAANGGALTLPGNVALHATADELSFVRPRIRRPAKT